MKQITKFNFSKLLTLAVFVSLLFAISGQAKAEIPNGDGDLLWERGLNGRTVNDAVFHPINGNIIAAVNHEIWEIDRKDGHTIRVFEGGIYGREIKEIRITNDGNLIVANVWGASGIVIWNYETGSIWKTLKLYGQDLGILPNNKEIIFYYPDGEQICRYDIYNEVKKDSQIIKGLNGNAYVDVMRLSKDGKYLAIGKAEAIGGGHWKYSMELWDAETLTPIRSFGSPGDNVHEFTDVQISNDDQYFAFATDFNFFIYKFSGKLVFTTTFPIYLHESQFTNDSKMILIRPFNSVTKRKAFTYFFNLTIMDSVYKYNESHGTFRFNSNNELFVQGYDSLIGVKIQLFSNHWYTVGVNEPAGTTFKIEQVNYTKNNLQIITNGIDIIDDLIITDTLGKRIYQQNNITITNNQAEIPLSLPSGNYLIKLIANGKELTGKFIVVN